MMHARGEMTWRLVLLGAALTMGDEAWARIYRVDQIPNGGVFRCANCHVSPNGGGTRTAFGNDVYAITGSLNKAFWSAALAQKDSDGDGATNGQELGDPEGVGTPTPGATVTNPGNASSKPPSNQPPAFTSTAATHATIGLVYQYQATALDPEGGTLTFAKSAGPAWLTVSTSGLVSGSPPDFSAGTNAVTLRVTDNGSPAQSVDQTYQLTVTAAYEGWKQMKFTLPAEELLSGPLVDPDNDGLPNLVEYAWRLDPRTASVLTNSPVTFNASHQMELVFTLRDDDPKLGVQLESADSVVFPDVATVNGVVVDPNPSPGMSTYRFTDSANQQQATARFARLKLELAP